MKIQVVSDLHLEHALAPEIKPDADILVRVRVQGEDH